MLVKIIAAGLAPNTWRKVLQQLRAALPEQPFSVGMFTTRDELEFLTGSFFPRRFAREAPDFLLSPVPSDDAWESQTQFLLGVQELPKPPGLVLALEGLEPTLKGLIAVHGSLRIALDTGNTCTVTDPTLLVKSFPADFPRIKVDGRLRVLRFKGGEEDVDPKSLADGTLVGFSELEAVLGKDETFTPKSWLKGVLSDADAKRAPRAAGLIKEAQGLFLFPGVPLAHVCGLTFGGLHFPYLIDLRQLHAENPQFAEFTSAVQEEGRRRLRAWKANTVKIRQAEAKADIPIVCAGSGELLRESLAALLVRQGHQRCFTLSTPAEGVLKEPSLVLQVAPWEKGQLGAQTASPLVMDICEELDARMRPLDGMLPWRGLKFEPPPVDIPPLAHEEFAQQRERLSAKSARAAKKQDLEERRALLMEQEAQVLQAALHNLGRLLDAADTIQIWSGEALSVDQLLLFSYDQEEAATVMQAVPHIAKKRWVDLAPFTGADAMQNLDLDELLPYARDGAIRITPAAMERLVAQRESSRTALEQTRETLEASRAHLNSLREDEEDTQSVQEKLARHWVWESLGDWMKGNRPRLAKALNTLRERQENLWFNRSHVRRALILPGQQENGAALLKACEAVYPSFSRDHSIIVPYEYDMLDALADEEAQRIREAGRAEGLAAGGIAQRLERARTASSEARFAEFLQLVSSELTGVRTDLVLIEHHPEIAPRILEHLRNVAPRLAEVPAVLILSDLWSPPANKPLPWPRTRVALLPRMGALTTGDCAEHLLALYSN